MPQQKHSRPADPSQPVVVVVEDSPVDQVILKQILESAGYHVLIGYYGVKGLELLDFCRDQKLNLTAIVSDIMMPVMDGMQFLQEVRRRPDTFKTPFLFMTAVNDSFMWDAKKYGANGFLTKPIEPAMLLSKLREVSSRAPSKVEHEKAA